MDVDAIALGRCEKLFQMAAEIFGGDPQLSRRYVSLARKIGMRHRLPLGSKRFCKACGTIFIPGRTLKVRTSPSRESVIYACMECNSEKMFPYSKEKRKMSAKP